MRLEDLLQAADPRGEPEPPPSDDELEGERARILEEVAARAAELRHRWRDAPPPRNRPTGRADVDALAWFKYVETEGL